MKDKKKGSLWSTYLILALDNFGYAVAFILFAPLLLEPEYHFLKYDPSIATRNILLALLYISFPLMQFFGAPLFGDLADQLGRKKSLFFTLIGTAFGLILSAIAIYAKSYSFLLASRAITGFFAGNFSICMAAIADLSPDEKTRAKNYGFTAFILGFSWPVAILIGGFLSDPKILPFFSPAFPFWFIFAGSGFSIYILLKLFQETSPKEPKKKFDLIKGMHLIGQSLTVPQIRLYSLALLFWTLGWGLSVQWYAAFSIQRFHISQQLISIGLAFQGLSWSFGASFINTILLRKLSSFRVAIIGYSICTLLIFASSIPNEFLLFTSIYCISAAFSSFALSNNLNLISLSAPENMQGTTMGISQSVIAFGFVLVPILGGLIGIKNVSLFYPISGALLLIALAILSMHWFFHKKS